MRINQYLCNSNWNSYLVPFSITVHCCFFNKRFTLVTVSFPYAIYIHRNNYKQIPIETVETLQFCSLAVSIIYIEVQPYIKCGDVETTEQFLLYVPIICQN